MARKWTAPFRSLNCAPCSIGRSPRLASSRPCTLMRRPLPRFRARPPNENRFFLSLIHTRRGSRLRLNSMLLQRGLACCAASALLLLTACQSKQGGADVVASVDGRKIFRNDVEKYYLNQTSGADQQQAVPVGEQATSLRLSILRELIDDEILMHRAEKLGLLATDEEVDRKMNEIKSPYTQKQYDKKIKYKKITLY